MRLVSVPSDDPFALRRPVGRHWCWGHHAGAKARCWRMRGPQPTVSSITVDAPFSSKPDLTNKPVVQKCIDQIMSKTGLSLTDAKAVLRHMLRTDRQHRQMGPNRGEHRVVAPTSSFQEMVRSGEWKRQARTPLRDVFSQPAATSRTTSPPLMPRHDEDPLVTRVPPDRHPAEIILQLSRPDGCLELKSRCTDGLLLLSTTASALARST